MITNDGLTLCGRRHDIMKTERQADKLGSETSRQMIIHRTTYRCRNMTAVEMLTIRSPKRIRHQLNTENRDTYC